jgi:hypothetical protein
MSMSHFGVAVLRKCNRRLAVLSPSSRRRLHLPHRPLPRLALPKKDIASRRAIRTVCVEALWAYSGHVHMVLCARWQEQRGQLWALAHGLLTSAKN